MKIFRPLFILCLIQLALVSPLLASDEARPVPQLTVRGDALLQVPADQARLHVGVENEGVTAEAALAENSKLMRTLEQALLKAGLEKGEYRTGRFSVVPQWSQRPKNPPADWRPQIVGYRVGNSFELKTGKLASVGKFIEAAAKAGANDIGQIVFDLADPRKHRQEAIAEAAANAIADAETLAKASGVKLVRILAMNLDQAYQPPVPRPYAADMGMAKMMLAESAPPIVAPEDLEVRAGVTVSYEIGQP